MCLRNGALVRSDPKNDFRVCPIRRCGWGDRRLSDLIHHGSEGSGRPTVRPSRGTRAGCRVPGSSVHPAIKHVLESVLESESKYLGHRHVATEASSNVRNGLRSKNILAEIGRVKEQFDTVEPVIVSRCDGASMQTTLMTFSWSNLV